MCLIITLQHILFLVIKIIIHIVILIQHTKCTIKFLKMGVDNFFNFKNTILIKN